MTIRIGKKLFIHSVFDVMPSTLSAIRSHVAQLVGCWTHNPRVVGSIPW